MSAATRFAAPASLAAPDAARTALIAPVLSRADSCAQGASRADSFGSQPGVDLADAPVGPLRIALAGCGTVGSALARQLVAYGAPGGREVRLVSVLVRQGERARACVLPSGALTTSVERFLATPADIVVETLGGIDQAFHIVRESLRAGRRVVTANKALVAVHGASLAALAAQSHSALDFEGAVGGSIPVVRTLRSGAAGLPVRAIRAVLNGTSNFVLGRALAGASFGDAVREAQARGFAEAIPDRDLDGRDAADKIAILAWLAFGVAPHMLPVHRRPLDDAVALSPVAAALGCATRQLAEVEVTPAGLVASVEPALVARSHALGRTEGEWNTVSIESASAGAIVLSGPGAGGDATAGALYADIGARSAPLPLPAVARVSARDERRLRWIVLSRASDAVLAAAAAGACRAEGSGPDGATIYGVSTMRDDIEALCGRLRAAGDAPLFARDLR